MYVSLLSSLMVTGWAVTLIGGLGMHVLTHFNGRRLEAYCRMRRNRERFGEILDHQEDVVNAAQFLLLLGLVVGSLAAGGWFTAQGGFELTAGRITGRVGGWTVLLSCIGWVALLTLSGIWLPRVVVHYSSSLFLFHSWPLWRTLAFLTRPVADFGDVFAWLGHRLSDEPDGEVFEEEVLEDEIRTMVTAGQREGVFSDGVPEMIQGVMELDDVDVEQIMTPRSLVDAIDVALSWDEVVKHIASCGRTRIPVYQERLDNIIGILFVKDLLGFLAETDHTPGPGTLESLLRKAWFIPASKPVDQLLRIFLHNRNHMAIVMDEYDQFMGVVTIEDALEEIVGEIADELDIDEESNMTYDAETHRVEAQGKTPIESVGKMLGVELPESDDYDTVGGLIIHRLSRIPTVGTTLDLPGIQITVLKATRRLVQRVRLELVDGNQAKSEYP